MFVDASAMCAILLNEDGSDLLIGKLANASQRSTSPIAVFETVRALMRAARIEPDDARRQVARFLTVARIDPTAIGPAEREAALDAMARFGKGRHPARLNMGDCFAYGCALTSGAPLLFKGDDFSQTDIEAA
jgi:ribonuclease VapC